MAEQDEGPDPKAKKRAANIVTQLINLTVNSKADLFRTPEGELFATVPVGNPTRETYSLGTREFKQWLARAYFKAAKRGASGGAISDAVMTLSGIAMSANQVHPVHSRVAAYKDRVYLDLCRDDHRVVEIRSMGWEVAPCPSDVRFVRREGMLPLPDPVRGRSACDVIPEVVNVPAGGPGAMMIVGWMVGALRGIKPYPILVVIGEQGSGKSEACRLIRDCIDPSQANLSLTPKEPRDLLITARNSHVIGFDNLSFVPDWLSDVLCCVATGAGFRTRTLTTDSNETIFSAARPVVMNSIADIVRRGDLMDRALVVETEPISEGSRRTQADVDAKFQEVRSEVLGSLCTAVSQALREPASLDRLPRMADFAVTVESAAPTFGWTRGQFLDVYFDVRKDSAETLLEGDLVTSALRKLHDQDAGRSWRGSTDELRERITNVTPEKRREDLPKNPKALVNHLRRVAPALRTIGIVVELPKLQRIAGELKRTMHITYPLAQEPIEFEPEEREEEL